MISRRKRKHEYKISFVTCTLNSNSVLESLLSSIASQSISSEEKRQIEWIFVDGDSKDGTYERLTSVNLSVAKKIVQTPPRGISDAFNFGVSASQGEWIVFIGSDDYLSHERALSSWLHSIDMLGRAADIIYSDGLFESANNCITFWKTSSKRLWASMSIFHPGTVVRRDLFDDVGFFSADFKIAMDYDWILRARKTGARLRKVDVPPFVVMRLGGVSTRQRTQGYTESRLAQIMIGHPKALAQAIYAAKLLRFDCYDLIRHIFNRMRDA